MGQLVRTMGFSVRQSNRSWTRAMGAFLFLDWKGEDDRV